MGFVNPFVDSDDEDDNIFKFERNFFDVFNTIVNSGCATNVFKLTFRFLVFPKIPEILETLAHKKVIFNTTAKLKCCELWYFVQTAKLKRY